MKLSHTRALINAIHSGELASAPTERDEIFGLDVVARCAGVPDDILIPHKVWTDQSAYQATAKRLAGLFRKNFAVYESGVSTAVSAAAPGGA